MDTSFPEPVRPLNLGGDGRRRSQWLGQDDLMHQRGYAVTEDRGCPDGQARCSEVKLIAKVSESPERRRKEQITIMGN